jgi:putative two-component system response regulator
VTRYALIAAAAGSAYLVLRARRELRARERLAAASLETLLNAIDANDGTTGAHVRRVAAYALVLARAAGLDEHAQRSVERVALFHDIGKIHEALFDIVHEPSALSEGERQLVATHPQRGAEVLRPLCVFYPDLSEGVLAHHERWDGNGYPHGLRGRGIPLNARIVTIADTFDVITTARPYKRGESAAIAARRIADGRGKQFDPRLVDRFLAPDVFARVERALADAHRPRSGARRRARPQEEDVPDVTFRWRGAGASPPTPDPALPSAPG